MTGLEEKLKLAALKSCLKSLMATYRSNFNKLAADAEYINEMFKEILKLEERKNDE